MKRNGKVIEMIPVIKVNNRFLNIEFYTKVLGFKVLHEENAFADLGSYGDQKVQLILEESPAARTRKVKGPKKLAQVTVKVAIPEEIEHLLDLGAPYQALYQGPKGWAFTAESPEGDIFLLHAEDNVAELEIFKGEPIFKKGESVFDGLSRFAIESVDVRTKDVANSKNLFVDLFPDVPVRFIQAEGEDLQVANNVTWDLVGLELMMGQDKDLAPIAQKARKSGLEVFVDKKERFLTVTDQNGLDIKLRK
ncbi:CppA N-terminal domain-containing protein [Streptococcus rifensis]